MNFNQSSQQHLDVANQVLTDVASQLSSINPGDPKFNVSKYAKTAAEQFGVEELFVAYLVRSVVNNCDEYESKRGRGGGVGPVATAATTPVQVQAEEPAPETVPEPSLAAPDASPEDIAELVSTTENDNSDSADVAVDV